MLKLQRFAGLFALLGAISVSSPAFAHPGGDWYDVVGPANARFPWDESSDTIYSFSSGSTWPSGWKNAVQLADDKWDTALGATLFSANAAEEPFPGTYCGNDFNGQEIVRRGPLNGIVKAETVICRIQESGERGRWWITIGTGYTWYPGQGDAPAGELHLRGTMTHEFGHATGFGTGTEPGEDAGHFYEADDTARPIAAADRATMCSKWGSNYQTYGYLQTSLEAHDKHTFLNVY